MSKHMISMLMLFFFITFTLTSQPLSVAIYVAAPEEIVVNEGESIQAAIDAAPVNSVIRIMPGKYCEQLKINKPLKLIGSGDRTIIQCSGTSTCVKITKGTISVVLANLCIDGAGSYKSTGVFIEQSHHNQLLNLTIRNFYKGLRIYDSMDNFLRNVNLLNNTYNFEVYGLYLSHFIHDIDISNTVNGRKIYYLVNVRNTVLRGGDVGYVAIINSTDVLVTNLLLSENFSGLLLAYTNNTTICNVTCTKNIQGIRLVNSHNITISENSFLQNEWSGISFEPATTCKIYSNIFKFNQHAIYLSHAPYILKVRTTGNKVFLNKIINNTVGLYVNGACSNEIFNNDFIRNEIAVEIDNASGNKFYGNNFLENRKDVNFVNPLSFNVTNFWDRGYPAAGNYWSKYNYVDEYEGPFQNVSGSDGVIDNPFLIEIEYSNIDRYPLLRPIATFRGIQSDSEGLFEISGNFSEILDFNFNPDHLCVIFKFVANSSNIFCRIGIPHSLFLAENDDWRVFLNGSCVEYKIYKGIDHTILYFKTPAMGNSGFHVWEAKILGTTAISEVDSNLILIVFIILATTLFVTIQKLWKSFGCKKVMLIFLFFSMLLSPFDGICAIGFSDKDPLIVGDDGFKTISEAIRMASDGDKIIVKAGIYREQLVIDKKLVLYGEGWERTIIETNGTLDAVVIVTNNVSVKGFTIRNLGEFAYSNGIRLTNASNCLIEENLVEGKFIGIKLENGSCSNIIRNNVLRNNHYGMFLMRRSSGNIIFNNSIINSGWNGVELAWYSNNNMFEANYIANSGAYGIEIPIYTPSYGNIIFHNNFLNNSLKNPFGKHASDFFNNSWFFNSEGNFWDDNCFTEDCDKDGIGDVWYCINEEREVYDKFPLMGEFRCYNFLNETVSVISSSKLMSFNVTVYDESIINFFICLIEEKPCGFLRLRFQQKLLTNITKLDSNVNLSVRRWIFADNRYIYIEYTSGENLIHIYGITEIPEFNSEALFYTLLAVLIVLTYSYWGLHRNFGE